MSLELSFSSPPFRRRVSLEESGIRVGCHLNPNTHALGTKYKVLPNDTVEIGT